MKDDSYWLTDWNRVVKKLVKDDKPYPYVNEGLYTYCEELIMEAKEKYYLGVAMMSDTCYDRLEDLLRRYRPDSKVLQQVGYVLK